MISFLIFTSFCYAITALLMVKALCRAAQHKSPFHDLHNGNKPVKSSDVGSTVN